MALVLNVTTIPADNAIKGEIKYLRARHTQHAVHVTINTCRSTDKLHWMNLGLTAAVTTSALTFNNPCTTTDKAYIRYTVIETNIKISYHLTIFDTYLEHLVIVLYVTV